MALPYMQRETTEDIANWRNCQMDFWR